MKNLNDALDVLKDFISPQQLKTITDSCRGEEGAFFKAKIIELAAIINTMSKTYEQDGMGDNAIAYLHYFKGGMDWYITEKDTEPGEQLQAHGVADLGFGPELGYISLPELFQNGCEVDLHWTPKRLAEINQEQTYDDSEEKAAAYEALRDREIGPELYDHLGPEPEQLQQQINATVEIVLAAPADKPREEYTRMIRHTLTRALMDRPMMFHFESLKITSLMEEADIYGNTETPIFNYQQSKEQNIAAIMSALHQHEGAGTVYENIGPHVGGFPGIYDIVIGLAAKLSDWEEANFGTFGGAYEENYTDWVSITDGIAQALVEEAHGADTAFEIIDTKALVERALFNDYAGRVDNELRKVFAVGIDDAGIDDDAISRARERNQDPVDYAHWLGEKYDMDAIYPAQKLKPPSGKM